MNFREVVRDIQRELRTVSPNLAIDGFWGPKSSRVYHLAPIPVQHKAQQIADAGGLSIDYLDDLAALPGSPGWVSVADVDQAVVQALLKLDPTLSADAARAMIPQAVLALEARTLHGKVFLRSLLVTSSSHAAGPFQFEPAEWNEIWQLYPAARSVMKFYADSSQYVRETEAGAPGSPGDLHAAATAFAGELLQIRGALYRNGLPVTPEAVYTLHNQGVTGGIGYLKGLRPIAYHQSPQAVEVMAMARSQVHFNETQQV